ncbi:VOC family protein [Halorussus gelatinilyticus]|uniref:VOC family protein n=1 Tax=Halorussus gelatinilyticus TaxID=2937524 RepID=A0A8U0IJ54_9EURY|nr:VOC family protein [Halorussus gelatinilyticus]UPW00716.1 VOC family protein [Halorussus gelatinilyticus]
MTDSETPPLTDINHVTNICTDMDRTQEFYEDVLGFYTVKMTENYDDPGTPHYYFSPTPEGEPGTVVSYFEYPNSRGNPGPGASHHFALGVEDEATLREWRDYLQSKGVRVSQVRDRTYFESIYLSDPDGLTIEICTEGPGFGVDEETPGSEFVEAPEQR